MRVRKDIYLEILEKYGYSYECKLAFPTYKKITTYGNKTIIIEILVQNRNIYINKSNIINKKNEKFILDLIIDNLIEK